MSDYTYARDTKKLLSKMKIKQLKLFCDKYNDHVMMKNYKKLNKHDIINYIMKKVYNDRDDDINGIAFDTDNGTARPLFNSSHDIESD